MAMATGGSATGIQWSQNFRPRNAAGTGTGFQLRYQASWNAGLPETLASGVKKGRLHVRISRPHRLLFAAFCDRRLLLRVLPDGAAGGDTDDHNARGHLARLQNHKG